MAEQEQHESRGGPGVLLAQELSGLDASPGFTCFYVCKISNLLNCSRCLFISHTFDVCNYIHMHMQIHVSCTTLGLNYF